jgi:hypothetical protein
MDVFIFILVIAAADVWLIATAVFKMNDLADLEADREVEARRCVTCGYPRRDGATGQDVCTECGTDPTLRTLRPRSGWWLLPAAAGVLVWIVLLPVLGRAFPADAILVWLGLLSVPFALLTAMAGVSDLAKWPRRLRLVLWPALVVLLLLTPGCMASVPAGRAGGYPAGFGQSLAAMGLAAIGVTVGPLLVYIATMVQLGDRVTLIRFEEMPPSNEPAESAATLGRRPGAGM